MQEGRLKPFLKNGGHETFWLLKVGVEDRVDVKHQSTHTKERKKEAMKKIGL